MEMRRLGKTEMQVSRIGFGGMTIPEVSVPQALATINRALDLGVNFMDTARLYGNGDSERKIGRAMEHRRTEAYLSSRTPNTTYDGVKKAIDESLEALRTDYIDLYEAHDVSSRARYAPLMRKGGGLQALREAKEEGKIRHIGFTSHDWDLIKKMIRSNEFEAGLVTYNLADREAENEVLDLAAEHDVGLFAMKVFGNGSLLELSPPDEERRPTVAQCLRFALSNPRFPLILTGVKSPEEIEQNVAVANIYQPLSKAEEQELRDFGDRLGCGYCYGCKYCLPCPQEINIPGILQLLDYQERISYELPQGKKRYAEFDATIEDCIDCEHCEQRCPQNLPIRERLKKAHDRFAEGGP